jgi:L-fuculose-phosphate aldolase
MNHLHFTPFATERDLRQAILEAGRLCYASGLMLSNNGNISVRLGDDKIVITPAGLCKGRMDSEDLLVIDLAGNILKVDHRRKRRISSETPMHLEAYRQRPDIRAIIHAHPSYATALTVADIPFPTDILPEVLEGLGPVPTTRFAIPSSEDVALAIRDLIKEHNAVLIRNHGAIAVGHDLDQALNYMERLETVATTLVMAYAIGKVNRLPKEITEPLLELRRKMSQR